MTVVLSVTTPRCMGCGAASILVVDADLYARWQAGELIQDVWPDWTPGQRELLKMGTHPKCWDKMFPPELDEPTARELCIERGDHGGPECACHEDRA